VGIHDPRVAFLIGIGVPLGKYDFDFLSDYRKPLLLVHGENDEFGDVEELRKTVAELDKHTAVRLVVLPGAGHFFDDRLDDLKRAISEWATEQYG
jgi:alpha/beta superfamily hydrolase